MERLLAREPRQILVQLAEADPLDLEVRAVQRARERCLLMDAERLHLRSAARVAHAAGAYDGTEGLEAWLAARIDEAIADLLELDRRDERAGLRILDGSDPRCKPLADIIPLDPGLVLSATVAFNDLEEDVRTAFFRLIWEARSVDECLAMGLGPPGKLRERTLTALRALTIWDGPEPPPPQGDGT